MTLIRLVRTFAAPEFVSDRARLQSTASQGASLWLVPPPVALEENVRLDDPVLARTALRIRLGLPLKETLSVCKLCGRHDSDVFGNHALSCMTGGGKSRAHNAIRDQLYTALSFALFSPSRENHCFGDNQRMDIVFQHGPTQFLVDVAMIHSALPQHAARAAETAGGACTHYEDVKVVEYGHRLLAHQKLVPFVVDSYGAYGKSCGPLLGLLAKAYAGRYGDRSGRALVFTRLNLAVTRAVATLACACG